MGAVVRSTATVAAFARYVLASVLALAIVVNTPADAASDANRELAVSLLITLGDSVDVAGRRIRQVDASNRKELAVCFAKLREVATHLFNQDWERCRNSPGNRPGQWSGPSCSQWASFIPTADVAYQYAIGAPGIESSFSYNQVKQMEAFRRYGEAMAQQLGMDMEALRRWGNLWTGQYLQGLVVKFC